MFPHDSTFSSASTSTEIKQETDVHMEDPEKEFLEQVDVKVEPEEHENEENPQELFSQFFREKRIRKRASQVLNELHQDESTKNESDFEPEEFQFNYGIKKGGWLHENESKQDSNDNDHESCIKETFSLVPLKIPATGPTCEQICSFCHKKFPTLRKLKNHIRIHDKRHICPVCEYRTSSESGLKIHQLTHTGQKPWKCPEPDCEMSFRQKQVLKNHEFSVHGKNKKNSRVLRCQLCPFKTNRNFELKNHVKIIHEVQMNSRYSSASTVQMPNKKQESKSQVEDPKLDTQNNHHQQQQQSSKPELKSFTLFYHCDNNCDFYTQNQKQVAAHLNTEHKLPRVVLKKLPCGLKTVKVEESKNPKEDKKSSLDRLLQLRRRHHPSIQKSTQKSKKEREIIPLFKCSQSNCSYSNPYKYNVRCHEFSRHGKRGNLKIQSCSLCSYETPRKAHLNFHVDSVHKGLRKLSCEQNRVTFKRHMDIVHHDLKNWSCDFCSFKTGRRTNLQRHVQSSHLLNQESVQMP